MSERWYVGLYEKSRNMAKPWVDAGYRAYLVDKDLEPGEHEDGPYVLCGADMRHWAPPRWLARADVAFLAAFPPCDHLAASGARWFPGKGLGKFEEAVTLFGRAVFWAEWFGSPFMIENPISTIGLYWRKADHQFSPFEYAAWEPEDNYTKRTCLWTGGGFVMPARAPLPGVKRARKRIENMGESKARRDLRSVTPRGFARATFEANRGA